MWSCFAFDGTITPTSFPTLSSFANVPEHRVASSLIAHWSFIRRVSLAWLALSQVFLGTELCIPDLFNNQGLLQRTPSLSFYDPSETSLPHILPGTIVTTHWGRSYRSTIWSYPLIRNKSDWITFLFAGLTATGLNLIVYGPRTKELMIERIHQSAYNPYVLRCIYSLMNSYSRRTSPIEGGDELMKKLNRAFSKALMRWAFIWICWQSE